MRQQILIRPLLRPTCLVLLAACYAQAAEPADVGLPAAGAKTAATHPQAGSGSQKALVYIGTYTAGDGQGIFTCELDLESGALRVLRASGGVTNPSFLALHPSNRYLYSVSEVAGAGDGPRGAVAAFSIDAADGRLLPLNHQPSAGAGPCHLVVDREGKNVLVANYSSGSVAALPIDERGRLQPAASSIQHRGSSVNPGRQEGPHAHSINLDAAGRFAFAADLGLDKVLIYRFDPARGALAANDPPDVALPPGSGPRHFAFHPDGQFAYVINELNSTISALRYDANRGALEVLHSVSTLPAGYSAENYTAEVQVHPSGKFVYGSNRGHDSIAIFAVDAQSGRLTPAGHCPTGGKVPRNFGLDPTGRFLLAANQDSGTIVVLRIDQRTGSLTPTEQRVEIPKPVCVKFARRTP